MDIAIEEGKGREAGVQGGREASLKAVLRDRQGEGGAVWAEGEGGTAVFLKKRRRKGREGEEDEDESMWRDEIEISRVKKNLIYRGGWKLLTA